jgi:ankyrin repeat protein
MSAQNQMSCNNCKKIIPENYLCECGMQAKLTLEFMKRMRKDKLKLDLIRSLTEKGADPNIVHFRLNEENYSGVTYVLKFSTNIELIRYFISKQQMSQNISDFITDNIFMAVYLDNENLVKFLLEKAMIDNINKKCVFFENQKEVKYTPLHYAVKKRKFGIVRLLLNSNLQLEHLPGCLGNCIVLKQYSLAKIILDKKVDPNFIGISKESPLTYSVKNDDMTAIKLLKMYGANPLFDVNGTTALQLAFSDKKFEIVMILLGSIVSNIFRNDNTSSISANHWKSLDPNSIEKENFCKKFFLYYAIDFNDFDFVKFLLSPEQNILFDELNDNGYTPLLYALKREDIDIEIVKILSSSYDVNQKNPIGELTWTPLLLAIDSNNHDAVKSLLDNGAKIDLVTISNKIKWTPILYAVFKGSLSIVEELMNRSRDRGIDIIKPIWSARIPFNYSIEIFCEDYTEHRFSIFKFFLDNKDEYKIDINLVDVFGMTPLKWAIESRKDNVIKLLLESNATVDQSVLDLLTKFNSSHEIIQQITEIIQRITEKMPKNDEDNSKKRKRVMSLSLGAASAGGGPVHSLVTPAASDRSSFLTGSAQTSPGGTLLTTSVTTSTTTVKTTTTMSVLSADPDEAARILMSLGEVSGNSKLEEAKVSIESNEESESKKIKPEVIDLTQDDD